MDFIQTSNKQVDKFGTGKHGFSPGNPTSGILATLLSNLWCDGVQQEIINVIEGSGQSASGADLTQLLKAIRALCGFPNIAIYQRIGGVSQVSVNGTAYTTSGATAFIVPPSGRYLGRVWAPGGGSGGTFGANSGSQGGAGGGYRELLVTGATPGSSLVVTLGAPGTFGTPNGGSPTSGTAGGTSSIGAVMSATGGGGGIGANGVVAAGTASPGTGDGGAGGLSLSGGSPSTPFIIAAGTYASTGGAGAMGGTTAHAGAQAVSTTGGDGKFPGGGASGSLNQANGGAGGGPLTIILS